ncbi:yciI-like protein [Asticcacaulis biprosthecium C19]|uniref:YciI-like protein n=1 Tax=Asticcacaulis biprosthecium C19 TaxID=715226 RepID=F4QMM6_9CAUL|nr:YciI-like protein [Asticcacaulis biprosthecium]EGF91467.1 yciI-like protein [Asticcacaulis biprosthecium C19]
MKHFLLFYDFVDDYLDRRGEFRGVHLDLASAAADRGDLVLGGALANPADGGVLLFLGADSSVAENFAQSDPYVVNGLVRSWKVREWTTVVGDSAATPVRP